jgi:pilus assembly protein CpaF
MNTGHEGSITTCHANDPAGAVRRLVTLVSLSSPGISTAAASDLVTSAVDAVVHVARDAAGARHVAVVAEVVPHSSDGRTRTLAVGGEVVDATLGRCRA